MSESLRIILNPSSGSGAGRRLLPRLRAALEKRRFPFRLDLTEGPGHALELAAGAGAAGATAVLAAGGDGTVHEVANGLLASAGAAALAVLPVGTGNDFHRMVGTDRSIGAALDLVEHGTAYPFDVGRVRWAGGEGHFVNVLGVGLDVEVLRRRDRFRRLPGLAQYGAAVLSAALGYRPLDVELVLDGGERRSDPTLLTAVSVGPSVGGGFRLSPDARPDDGLLDLLFVSPLSFVQVLRYLPRVIRGTHHDAPGLEMRTMRTLHLRTPGGDPFRFELDGELVPHVTSFLEVEVVPAALPVLRPRSPAP